MSADFASGVELLNNYNDGNVGNSFNSKETTALNLINKDLHNKWAGNFTEGGGVKNKFDSKNSALKMDKKCLHPSLQMLTTPMRQFSL